MRKLDFTVFLNTGTSFIMEPVYDSEGKIDYEALEAKYTDQIKEKFIYLLQSKECQIDFEICDPIEIDD